MPTVIFNSSKKKYASGFSYQVKPRKRQMAMEMKDQVGTCDLTMKSDPREGRDPSGNEG